MSTCKRGCMVFSQKDKKQFCVICGEPEGTNPTPVGAR